MKKKKFLDKAIHWAEKKSIKSLRSIKEGYEDTKVFINKSTNEQIQPDVSYTTEVGAKHFSEIALKSDNTTKLVTRWKLLSILATMKNGKLHLLAPKGHKTFTQRIVNTHNINAKIYSL